MLTVYFDFKSPASYLALRPTLRLAERLGVEVDWQPFKTTERELPEHRAAETAGQSHRRVRAESRRMIHIKYAALQGIDLRFPAIPGETELALAVLTQMEGDRLPFVKLAFEAYWTDHQDLNAPDIVSALLRETGNSTDTFDPGLARHALDKAQTNAEELGIVDAPAYLVGEQIFIGREHLPWIENVLTSR